MSGAEVATHESIPYVLANLIGVSDYTNLSLAGCSNDRIYETTMQYLQTHTPDMVVIGWTESHRIQWFDTETGQLLEINADAISDQPYSKSQKARAAAIHDLMVLNSPYGRNQSIYWHNKIFNLHLMLQYRQIPHLFFSAIDLFEPIQQSYHLDWASCYYRPYDISYRTWAMNNNKQEITPGRYHYVGSAQIEWAHMLYDHIQMHGICATKN